jgi:hypothetical protein
LPTAILALVNLGEKLDDGVPRVIGPLAIRNRQAAGPLKVLGDGFTGAAFVLAIFLRAPLARLAARAGVSL